MTTNRPNRTTIRPNRTTNEIGAALRSLMAVGATRSGCAVRFYEDWRLEVDADGVPMLKRVGESRRHPFEASRRMALYKWLWDADWLHAGGAGPGALREVVWRDAIPQVRSLLLQVGEFHLESSHQPASEMLDPYELVLELIDLREWLILTAAVVVGDRRTIDAWYALARERVQELEEVYETAVVNVGYESAPFTVVRLWMALNLAYGPHRPKGLALFHLAPPFGANRLVPQPGSGYEEMLLSFAIAAGAVEAPFPLDQVYQCKHCGQVSIGEKPRKFCPPDPDRKKNCAKDYHATRATRKRRAQDKAAKKLHGKPYRDLTDQERLAVDATEEVARMLEDDTGDLPEIGGLSHG